MLDKEKQLNESRIFLNAGCGPPGDLSFPVFFQSWQQVRVDIDPANSPDLVANITNLSPIADCSVDAIWSSHCLEHLYAHEVPAALSEFRRVLREDGFLCIVVPDIQAIASMIATDRLDETIYESPSGPVTAHDVIWGFGPALATGNLAMAHHSGFTPATFIKSLTAAGFDEILLRRMSNLELVALVLQNPPKYIDHREELLAEMGFQK